MRLKTMIFIDQILGNLFIWLLLALPSPSRRLRNPDINPKRIVFLKLLGLGSIIQATPLLSALKDRYQGAEFIFVTKQGNEQLTQRIPVIDRTMTVDDSSFIRLVSTLFVTIRQLRAMDNVCFINLEAFSKLGILLAVLSRARWTAGFFRNPSDLNLEKLFNFLVYFNPGAPISEVYLQIGRALDADPLSPALILLDTVEADHLEVDGVLRKHGINEKTEMILVNPNSSELRYERRWPAHLFAEFINALIQQKPKCRIALIGSPGERDYVESLYRQIPLPARTMVCNLAGELKLGGLIALMKRSKLVISNDSGPMHIAFSVGTPTIALFGPVEPAHYSFNGSAKRNVVLYHRTYCSPCVHHFDVAPCHGDNVCMKMITVDETLHAALGLLRSRAFKLENNANIVYIDHGRPLGVVGSIGDVS